MPSPQQGTSRRSPTQCRQMALDIIHLYISLLSRRFTLSDASVASSSSASSSGTLAAFVPPHSNSLCTGLYANRILSEILDCIADIGGAEISSEATVGLKNLVESARWRFEDVLCETWARGACKVRRPSTWTSQLTPRPPSSFFRCEDLLSVGRLEGQRRCTDNDVLPRSHCRLPAPQRQLGLHNCRRCIFWGNSIQKGELARLSGTSEPR